MISSLLDYLIKNNLTISFAESISGGGLAYEIIKRPNASKVLHSSFVVYSNSAKEKFLNVTSINNYASSEIVVQMVNGLFKLTNSSICVATSGYSDSSFDKSLIGSCYYAIKYKNQIYTFQKKYNLKRTELMEQLVRDVYISINELLGV